MTDSGNGKTDRSFTSVARRTIKSVPGDICRAIYNHYIGVVASLIILLGSNAASYFFGIAVGERTTVVFQRDILGTHCPRTLFENAAEQDDNIRIGEDEVLNTLVCGRSTENQASLTETLNGYVKRYHECFTLTSDGELRFFDGPNTKLETWINADRKTATACRCVPGQARLVARTRSSGNKWCGIAAPNYEMM